MLFTSEQPKKNKMAFVGILSQIQLLVGPIVIQLVWYILKQSFTSVSVKVVDIYLHLNNEQLLNISIYFVLLTNREKSIWFLSTAFNSRLIEGNIYEARQTSKEQTKMSTFIHLCWKIHDRAQSFALRSYTMHELGNQHVLFLSME